jgi:hypothetical protein
MYTARCMSGDFNVLFLYAAQANRTSYLRVHWDLELMPIRKNAGVRQACILSLAVET